MIIHEGLFITPIEIHKINLFEEGLISKELNELLEKSVKDNIGPKNYKTNLKGKMTNYDFWNIHTSNLFKIIKNLLDKYFLNKVDLDCKDIWGGIYNKGDYATPHLHLPSLLSWVYYVKCENKNSGLTFHNRYNSNNHNVEMLNIQPKTGDLIIFPSYILHSVKEEKNDKERIIIAGNCNNKDIKKSSLN